ncbi:hypothetical protein BDZ91DRAFT_47126 [Kalaharituber pfeilii]|nr:hypothetical protein BDZ91DRAFT_47126 [Kalaharituber pfeilii]
MASFEYTKTSPSDSSDSNVHIDYFSQRSWSEEVLGSFGHGQPPPPTYKIPRKQVNSSLIHTPSNPQRSRQVSIAQSVSNGGRSSVQWNYQNGGLAVQYEDEGGANQERNAVTPVSPREGMEINFETAFRFSGLGRGNGAKRSGGSSVEVRVGDISRTTSAGTVRQFVIRKQSAVDRGERGIVIWEVQ